MALIIANPLAGRGRVAALIPRIEAFLKDRPGTRLAVPGSPEETHALVQEAPEDRIIVVGGDGTLHQVLRALRPDQALGVVPVGSGNDFARALGLLRLSWDKALTRALAAAPQHVDLGRVNGEPFAASLGIGFDAAVAERVLHSPGRLKGMPRYLLGIFQELAHLELANLELRDETGLLYKGPSLLSAYMNGPTYGGGFPIAPMAKPADGQLEAIVAGRFTRPGVLRVLPLLMLGRHLGQREIKHFSGRKFWLRFDRPVPAHADGEVLGRHTEYEVWIEPGALKALF